MNYASLIFCLFFLYILNILQVYCLAGGVSTGSEKQTELKRLPGYVIPTHYDLHILANLSASPPSLNSNGTVDISIKVLNRTKCFYLNAGIGMDIKLLQIENVSSSTALEVSSWKHLEEETRVKIETGRYVTRGETFRLHIVFRVSTARQNSYQGFYFSHGVHPTSRLTANTHHEPTYARYVFPCFDEPSFKASFKITLTHPSQYNVYSNMPLATKTQLPEGSKVDKSESSEPWSKSEFQTTPKMSTYLVAFAMFNMTEIRSNYTSIDGRIVPLTYHVEPWMGENAQKSLELSVEIFTLMEKWFQVPFPLPKCDFFASRIPAYAMENWGIISFSSKLIMPKMFDPVLMSQILAHEIAHQWFGNLVTPAWWTDLWLKEGLASYLSNLATQVIIQQPPSPGTPPIFNLSVDGSLYTSRHLTELLGTARRDIMDTDSLNSSKSVSRFIKTESDIVANFDKISYGKSCFLIEMIHETMVTSAKAISSPTPVTFSDLETVHSSLPVGTRMHPDNLGTDPFIQGIRSYLDKYAYSTASNYDLWASFASMEGQQPCKEDDVHVEDMMRTWTEEWGYPMVTVSVNYDTGVITFKQQKFVTDFSGNDLYEQFSPNAVTWILQLDLRTSKGRLLKPVWITEREHNITLDKETLGDWVMVQTNSRSYYRVNYDYITWRNLISAIERNSSVFSAMQKADLVDDAWALAFASTISMKIPLRITPFAVVNETDSVFWTSVLSVLRDRINIYGTDSPIQDAFSSYCKGILAHYPSESKRQIFYPKQDVTALVYEQMLAETKESSFMQTLKTRYDTYVERSFPSDNSLHVLTLCYAAKYFGINETVFAKFIDAQNVSMFSLSVSYFTNDLSQFKQVFNMTQYPPFVNAPLIWHPRRLTNCGHYAGEDFMWNYVMDNWDLVWNQTARDQARAFLVDIHFKSLPFTKQKLAKIEQFERDKFDKLGSTQNKFLEIKRRVVRYVKWKEEKFWGRLAVLLERERRTEFLV
ncbi:glutamyl aminopeptidase-like isoform X2 [Convolutriloba macropyga]|uniref:glutamyl aminopeptidase-like isoform X2 n=1 Tax=Convolutriloba macropyga TaxID=536237 RepID=UPI003F52752C